jgi:hypothetical protein
VSRSRGDNITARQKIQKPRRQTELNPHAPASPRTSRIVEPPKHATTVLHIVRCSKVEECGVLDFAAEIFPKLRA